MNNETIVGIIVMIFLMSLHSFCICLLFNDNFSSEFELLVKNKIKLFNKKEKINNVIKIDKLLLTETFKERNE